MRCAMRSRCGSRSADVRRSSAAPCGSLCAALSSGSCRLGVPSPRCGSGRLSRVGRDWVATHPRRPTLRWRCPPSRHPDGDSRMGTAAALILDLSARLSLWGEDTGAYSQWGRLRDPVSARSPLRLFGCGFQWGAQGEVAGGLVVLAECAKGGFLLRAQLLRVGASGAEAAA
jgi:hypothetical protein